MKLLMCQPDYYGVEYEINPWMNVQHNADKINAEQQWKNLYQTLLQCGTTIELIAPVSGLPDMVFTANGGLYYQNKIILPHFKHKERQGELAHLKNWFIQAGFSFLNDPILPESPYFEGAGDALLAGNTLFAGFGFRTDKRFYEQAYYLDHNNIVYCELVNPYFYHIDTCFCPINDKLAIWYPAAFSEASQKNMAKKIELIEVTTEEAKHFACNSVVLNNNHIVIPAGCPDLTSKLQEKGLIVHACDMSEFLKAGGACKCLTLKID
jgi:N-dimethylarginine dimethylaminohydrolase